MINKVQRRYSTCIALILLLSLVIGCVPVFSERLSAAPQTMGLSLAEDLAYANSEKYAKLKRDLALAEVQYTQSIKSIRMKEQNQRTFRWSPLLNFKFPEKPTLADESEYNFKPLELQSEIDSIRHELNNCIYEIYEKVALQFVAVYQLQETIDYNEERLKNYKSTLMKNRVRLVAGLATQNDVESMEKKISTLEDTIASDKRSFTSAKNKLSELINMDVSTGWAFESPFVSAEMNRSVLDELIDYTLENDNEFYKTRLATSNALLELNTNYDLMKKKYGSSTMGYIDSYINHARRGDKIDSAAFKTAFGEMLAKADKPWDGKIWILFIKIPKLWFKGATDGQRYVEDEPYVLYENALEYQNLLNEEKTARNELTNQVISYYETYISTKNSYEQLVEQSILKKSELEKAQVKNMMGEMEYDEYASVQEEFEELQLDVMAAQAAYSEAIYSLDKLTCGAVTQYMTGTDARMSNAAGGQSYVVEDVSEGAYYYIHSLVSDNLFEFGISVPDDYEISITDYELWVDGVQIGSRTEADKTLRHLALDIKQTERVFVRLFDGDTFLDDCEIDPSEYTGLLHIRSYTVEQEEVTGVGSYSGAANYTLGTYELTFTMNPTESAAFYNVRTAGGKWLLGEEQLPISDPFRYLSLAEESLAELVICFYDESGALLYEAKLDTSDGTIHKIME